MPEATISPSPTAASEVLAWLQAQWEEVVQVTGIDLDDNFFDVGGTSMHIVDVHSSIVDAFDLPELSLVDLFEHTTLRSLAAHLWRMVAATSRAPAVCGDGAPTTAPGTGRP